MLHFICIVPSIYGITIGLNDIKWAHVETSIVYNLNIKIQKIYSDLIIFEMFLLSKFKISKVYFFSCK